MLAGPTGWRGRENSKSMTLPLPSFATLGFRSVQAETFHVLAGLGNGGPPG